MAGRIIEICVPWSQAGRIWPILRRGFSHSSSSAQLKIGVQGLCLELGQKKAGVAEGPKKLRDTGFIQVLRDVVGIDIVDYGDVNLKRTQTNPPGQMFYTQDEKRPAYPTNDTAQQNVIKTHRLWTEHVNLHHFEDVAFATQAIGDSTQKILEDGRLCLSLGGDHSVGIGTVLGTTRVYKEELGLIWIDAHTDLNTPSTTNTGNLHGMSVSFHLKDMIPYMAQFSEFAHCVPILNSRNLVYIGVRDVEPYEKAFLDRFQIKAFSMKEIDQIGINGIIERTLDYLLPAGMKRPIHISLDVDSIDPHDIPTTGTPVPGGLTLREGMHLLEELEKTGQLIALDVVELNPKLGTELAATRAAQAAEELIFSCFQYYRGGMTASTALPKPDQPRKK